MKRIIIESPFSGDVEQHIRYGRRCIRHAVLNDEAPIASHLLFTQDGILDDTVPEERTLGMEAGFSWVSAAELVAVYTDYGVSRGMEEGIRRATEANVPIQYRSIGRNP